MSPGTRGNAAGSMQGQARYTGCSSNRRAIQGSNRIIIVQLPGRVAGNVPQNESTRSSLHEV